MRMADRVLLGQLETDGLSSTNVGFAAFEAASGLRDNWPNDKLDIRGEYLTVIPGSQPMLAWIRAGEIEYLTLGADAAKTRRQRLNRPPSSSGKTLKRIVDIGLLGRTILVVQAEDGSAMTIKREGDRLIHTWDFADAVNIIQLYPHEQVADE